MPSHGSPVSGIRFHSGSHFGKARCEIGWNWHPQPLADYDLWYAVSGRGEMRLDGAVYPVRKGACFLVRPGDQPQAEQDPEDRLTVIFVHFRIDVPGGDPGRLSRLLVPRCTMLDDPYPMEQLLNRMLETLDRREQWAEEEFDCIMKQVFLHLHRQNSRDGNRSTVALKQRRTVSRMIALIREQGGRRIAHEELAAQVGLSPQYASRLFKQCTGVSLKEFLTQVRLERAMHLLSETTMNVSQVAEALGYASVYLFSKQFKHKFGDPPSRFQMSALPPKPHGKR
jgi:AraC-like DNA-binding protein